MSVNRSILDDSDSDDDRCDADEVLQVANSTDNGWLFCSVSAENAPVSVDNPTHSCDI